MGVVDRFKYGLQASAVRVENAGRGGAGSSQTGTGTNREGWQARALRMYDEVEEVYYAATFYERPMSAIHLYVQQRNPDGDWVAVEDLFTTPESVNGDGPGVPQPDNVQQTAIEALEAFHDKGSEGRDGIQGGYGKLAMLNGEKYLVSLWDDTL